MPCPFRQCLRAVGQEEPHRSEQVGVAEQASERFALLCEQTHGTMPVASNDEVGVVKDGSRQRKGVAVIDQRHPPAVPAPVPIVTVLLRDERVEERRGQAPSRIQGRRHVPRPANGAW
ncbi:MAG TPA: hypothetical protein VIH71_12110 [Solirubrobacteraceae bacterium]